MKTNSFKLIFLLLTLRDLSATKLETSNSYNKTKQVHTEDSPNVENHLALSSVQNPTAKSEESSNLNDNKLFDGRDVDESSSETIDSLVVSRQDLQDRVGKKSFDRIDLHSYLDGLYKRSSNHDDDLVKNLNKKHFDGIDLQNWLDGLQKRSLRRMISNGLSKMDNEMAQRCMFGCSYIYKLQDYINNLNKNNRFKHQSALNLLTNKHSDEIDPHVNSKDLNKRSFDRIDLHSSLHDLDKKSFDRIDQHSSLHDLNKKSFDRIDLHSSLHDLEKRPFDRIDLQSGLHDLDKKSFDRIDQHSSLHDLDKRPFDRIDLQSSLHDLDKRSFDKIDLHSSLHEFEKRPFDRIDQQSSLHDLDKRSFDRIDLHSSLNDLDKRSFKKRDLHSSLNSFNKKSFDRIDLQSSLYDLYKRKLDLIDESGRPVRFPNYDQEEEVIMLEKLQDEKRSFDWIDQHSGVYGL